MPTKKKPVAAPESLGTTIEGCNFTMITAANEYTRDAVVALAETAKANADAIARIAEALKGGNITAPALQLTTN